jgi:hypothetical protein
MQVSQAKKLKVEGQQGQQQATEKKQPEKEAEKEPEKEPEEEQSDHNYVKKSDKVARAESDFLHSLQQAAGRLLADPAGHFDHKAELEDTASMLAARFKAARQEGKVVNVLELQEELMIAMDAPDNPFVLFPFNTDGNIYTNIVKFGALHTQGLLDMIGMLISTGEATINGDTVIQTAFLYTQLACSINPRIHSSYFKMLSVFLKTCGLTDTGLLALSKLGMCEAPRTLLNTKDNLAVLDEVMVKQQAAHGVFFAMFDNLNYKIMRTQLDYTLPVLLFETVATYDHSAVDGFTHDEKLDLFTADLLYMEAPNNTKYKAAVKQVVCTVLADVASAVPGLQWLRKVLPIHHEHVFKDTASNRTVIHTEPVMCLNEMDINNMIEILTRLQDR